MDGYNINYDQVRKIVEDLFFDFAEHIKYKTEKRSDTYEISKEHFDYDPKACTGFLYDSNICDEREYNESIFKEDYDEREYNENIMKEDYDEREYNKNRFREDYDESNHTDIDHLENVFSEINRRIYPYVIEILDEHEYEGSPIYNYKLDREFIAQMVDKVVDKSVKEIEEIEEINMEMVRGQWCRFRLLRGLIEANIMCELFSFRRPHYRKYNILR